VRARCAVGLVAAAAACVPPIGNGGDTPGAIVNGAANGQPVPTTATLGLFGSASQVVNGVKETSSYAGVLITNLANGCAELQRNGQPANSTALTLFVNSDTTTVPAGTYPIDDTQQATVSYTVDNSSCETTTNEAAATGSITLTTVSSTVIDGSFDVHMSNGDHLYGTFDAPVCPANLPASSDAACGT
jgi:hypothetical protein